MKFSREPSVWLGVIGSILTAGAALGFDFLNAGQAAAIVSFLTAVALAVVTRPIAPALFTAAFSALAAIFAEYGLHWSDAQVGAITAVILGGFALFGVRPQVSPSTFSGSIIPGQVVRTSTVSR